MSRRQDLLSIDRLPQFSVPQIEYPLGDSSKKGSHVCFLLIVAMVLLLRHQILLLWHHITIVASEQNLYQTIVLPRKLKTGNIHDYLICYCPLVGILFEVLRIATVYYDRQDVLLFRKIQMYIMSKKTTHSWVDVHDSSQ